MLSVCVLTASAAVLQDMANLINALLGVVSRCEWYFPMLISISNQELIHIQRFMSRATLTLSALRPVSSSKILGSNAAAIMPAKIFLKLM